MYLFFLSQSLYSMRTPKRGERDPDLLSRSSRARARQKNESHPEPKSGLFLKENPIGSEKEALSQKQSPAAAAGRSKRSPPRPSPRRRTSRATSQRPSGAQEKKASSLAPRCSAATPPRPRPANQKTEFIFKGKTPHPATRRGLAHPTPEPRGHAPETMPLAIVRVL